MKKEVLDYVVEKTHELMNAAPCSQEAKDAAQKWLDAIGTETEVEETEKYLAELKEDVVTIDNLIGFSGSDAGKAHFGEELASSILEHAKEIKAAGAQYCDCPACTAALAILEKQDDMLQ
ncbi:hypothetical protein [Candidatus Stoquefichus massiliensis]|uniref:hypothetical protein n=1 Tax=Candidatus Stoquefichus massiliensis TaxID=1470350 RepID=UPI0004892AB9|nr:hypothetical protein [Candidatus Stoquefichus massiliensis]